MENKYSNLRPSTIINEEVLTEKKLYREKEILTSKTNLDGNITYVNDTFVEISGYSKAELIGESHNIIRHPDMPKIIFKYLWEALKSNQNFHGILKDLSKDGRYYWVVTDYSMTTDDNGKIKGYTSQQKIAPKSVVQKIKPIYETLLGLEKIKDEHVVHAYFKSLLEEELNKSFDSIIDAYNEYVIQLFDEGVKKEVVKDRKKTVNKALTWFFSSDYVL